MKRIYLHELPVRIWHWINAGSFLMLIATGIQIRYRDVVHLTSFKTAVDVHNYFGFVLILNLCLWALYYALSRRLKVYIPDPNLKNFIKGTIRQARYYAYGIFVGEENPHHATPDSKFNPSRDRRARRSRLTPNEGKPMPLIRVAMLTAGLLFPWPAAAADFSPIPLVTRMTDVAKAALPFDLPALKRNWRERIGAMRAAGVMPLIDIESTLDEDLDMQSLALQMDTEGVALIAFSGFARGRGWSDAARYAVAADPWRYIPTGDGGLPPEFRNRPEEFVHTTRERITRDGYPLMGEYREAHSLMEKGKKRKG